MKKIIFLSLVLVIYSCNDNKTEANDKTANDLNNKPNNNLTIKQNKPISSNVPKSNMSKTNNFDPKKDADKNKDGIVNFKDWEKLSKSEKYKLISYYNDLTNQSLGLYPSKEIREKEINTISDKISKVYLSKNTEQKSIDIYELILSFS